MSLIIHKTIDFKFTTEIHEFHCEKIFGLLEIARIF